MSDTRDRGAALAGAFAEGIDLGPRGVHIRALGAELEATIATLRRELKGLGVEDRIGLALLDLDQLARVARAARAYGTP